MNAVIDLGNTFGKLALFEGLELSSIKKGINVLVMVERLKKLKPEHVLVCSVTKNVAELNLLFKTIPNTIVLTKDTPIPVINAYATPETLGYDRLAGATGAHFLFPNQNCLLIDMGTAIKYDFIDAKGIFKGGIISPGMKMRFKALHTFTKKLPLLNAEDILNEGVPNLIGNSTVTCIKSGVVHGISAEINGLISRYLEQGSLKIIISGGDSEFFESQINYPTFAAPNLVLEGLNRILKYNVEKKNFTK
ncbi:MAG: type III pantothenate kinase [Algoriphagus sp.]|jgi:type III pantothenate kinase